MPTSNCLPAAPRPAQHCGPHLGLQGLDGVVVDLCDSPQTIGGGPRCSVRLGDIGLRPLHCVVTPTPEGPVVRRWAAETQLNGAEFTEAGLNAGDVLTIGSVDLMVLDLADSLIPAPEPVAPEAAEKPTEPAEQAAPTAASETLAERPTETPEPVNESLSRDDSFEGLRAAAPQEAATPAEADDPAIPRHLLQPWAPTDALGKDTPDPGASDPDDELFGTSEATAFDWLTPADRHVDGAPTAEPSPASEADDPWTVDAPWEAPTAEAVVEVGVAEPYKTSEPGAAPVAESPALAVGPLRERLTSGRRRVAALAAALRDCRTQLFAAQQTIAERDEELGDMQSRVDAALAAADEASREIGRFHELAAKAESTEAALAASEAALADAMYRVDVLERRLEEASQTPSAAAAEIVDEAPIEEAPPSEALVAEASDALPFTDAIDEASSAVKPADNAPEDHGESVAEAPPADVFADPESFDPSGSSDGFAGEQAEAEPTEDEPMWGIERLAAEAPSVESLWDHTPEPAPPVDGGAILGGVAPEPVEEQQSEDEPWEEAAHADAAPTAYDVFTDVANETAARASAEDEGGVVDHVEASLDGLVEAIAEEPVAEEPAPEPAAPAVEPTSFIEKFAHLIPDEDEPVEQVAAEAPPEPISLAPAEPAEAPSGSGEDDSIDDYMRKLMERMRGGRSERGEPVELAVSSAPIAAPSPAPASDEPVSAIPAPEPEVEEPLTDLSQLRRGPAPTSTADIGALRQLANQSARYAIDIATTRQSREKATLRLTVSAVSLGCGVLASVMAASPFDVQFGLGMAAVVGGGWFGVHTLRSCQTSTRELEAAQAAEQSPA